MKSTLILVSSFLFGLTLTAQDCFPIDKEQIIQIKEDVAYLASDEMEGRAPGTAGAIRARDYIAKTFESNQVIPMGDAGYFQYFTVPEPAMISKLGTYLAIDKDTLALQSQYYPLQYSANANVAGKTVWVNFGITAPELKHDDYKKVKSLEGKIAVMDVSSPDGIHPHSAYAKYHDLGSRVMLAQEKGAIGVIMVNLGEMANDPEDVYRKIRATQIPVVFLKDDAKGAKLKKSKNVAIAVLQEERTADAYNVIGYVDNQQPTTVVIGAHYDHLGWGGSGSLYTGEPAIHNGADDNASGTAGLLALATQLAKKDTLTGHNYLFIAFTAEERGLLGSNYFVNNPTYELEQVAYMFNMDMIGRLREFKLQISGTGTALEWEEVLETLHCQEFNYKLDPSGVGPSDHTSFYNMGIPVLHFFTGSHEDYHKPSDDVEKVNYKGIGEVLQVIKTAIARVDKYQRLGFQQTKDDNARKAPRFSVTLGIMPDYMYEDGGVRVDGVTDGNPAANAGLQKGDIIVELGDFKIEDIYAYMGALAAFKKGDKAKIVYMRDGKRVEGEVQF